MASRPSVTYRLLGNERIAFTQRQIESMVRDGLVNLDTKVICDGESFATAISARPEFRLLLIRYPEHPRTDDS
jgi:hypothetical protein